MRIQRTAWPRIAAVRVQAVSNESDAGPASAIVYEVENSFCPWRGTPVPSTASFHPPFGASATVRVPFARSPSNVKTPV